MPLMYGKIRISQKPQLIFRYEMFDLYKGNENVIVG